jgi:site-specific DNA-methyltransferase (adenine-specific)
VVCAPCCAARALFHLETTLETLAVPALPHLNQLHLADASEFVRSLPPASIDMLLTDPPYCSGGLHRAARVKSTSEKYMHSSSQELYDDFDFDNMDQRSWLWWCQGWLTSAQRALKPGGLVVCFIDWRQLPALTDVIQAAGFTLRGLAVWDKTVGGARPRNGGFKQQTEFIVWASKGDLVQSGIYLPGVFQCRVPKPKQHLTEKPFDIAREIVSLVPAGGTVLDLFAGAGTFLLAAQARGLNWTGCELNRKYHALASRRLASQAGTCTSAIQD